MTRPNRKRARGNGEGSVRKRPDGSWEARFTTGTTPDGKQQRKSVYAKTRAGVVEKLKASMAVSAKLPADPSALKLTLTEYMLRVAAGRIGHLSVRTCEMDQSYIRYSHQVPAGSTLLRDLTTGHLEEWYNALAKTHSKSVVQHTRIFVNLALRQAVRRGHLLHHPGLNTELPRMTTTPIAKTLTPQAVAQLLEVAQSHDALHGTDMYLFLYLALSLGLRHGELLGLQWGDINPQASTLQIERAVTLNAAGAAFVTQPKTKASRRTLYLTPEHLNLLSGRQQQRGGLWVFATPDGKPRNQNNVRRSYRILLKAAGLDEKTRIHDLRHTFATYLIGGGFDPKTVADLMGHKDARLTLAIYTHTQDESRKKAALSASALVSPTTPKKAVGVE